MLTIAREKTIGLLLLVFCLLVLLCFALYVSSIVHLVAFSVPTIIYPRS